MSNDNIDLFAFRPDSKPYGKSFNEWAEEWTRWVLSIPRKYNPAADSTGKNCAQNQNGEVWFLAGTFGGSAKRQCNIPTGKALFFPVVTKECSFAEDYDLKTEDELSKRVKEFMDYVTYMELIVDQVNLRNLTEYRAHSRVFDFVFPEDNVYDVKSGQTLSVTDGYWAFLKPLPVGKHKIHFKAKVSLPIRSRLVELARHYNKIKGAVFKTQVSYEIIIIPNS